MKKLSMDEIVEMTAHAAYEAVRAYARGVQTTPFLSLKSWDHAENQDRTFFRDRAYAFIHGERSSEDVATVLKGMGVSAHSGEDERSFRLLMSVCDAMATALFQHWEHHPAFRSEARIEIETDKERGQ
ncbi:MAG TPA: hypothetical protein VGS96_09805 [Thermoanaerobaculia bacterium]|jgi:hypothetical protein|nr:hypothetical protein [Thermoanaerobaculia bacterium]